MKKIIKQSVKNKLSNCMERCRHRVPGVVFVAPLLQADLNECEACLLLLLVEGLCVAAYASCDNFAAALANAVRGNVTAPMLVFGKMHKQDTSTAGMVSVCSSSEGSKTLSKL